MPCAKCAICEKWKQRKHFVANSAERKQNYINRSVSISFVSVGVARSNSTRSTRSTCSTFFNHHHQCSICTFHSLSFPCHLIVPVVFPIRKVKIDSICYEYNVQRREIKQSITDLFVKWQFICLDRIEIPQKVNGYVRLLLGWWWSSWLRLVFIQTVHVQTI